MARREEGAARGKVTMWIMTAAAAAAGLAVTTALMLPGPQATGQSRAQSSSFNSDN
jgi:pectate lyase